MSSPSNAEPPTAPVADCWGFNRTEVNKFSYMWTIDNLSYCGDKVRSVLQSPTFSVDANGGSKWCLDLYPKGTSEEAKDYLALFLRLISFNKTEMRLEFQFSILTKRKEKKVLKKFSGVHFVQGGAYGYDDFIHQNFLHDKTKELLVDDKLTLFCEMNIVADSVSIAGHPQNFKIPEFSLTNTMEQLFESQRHSDFILIVDNREFFVHKCILSLHSPVFTAMFEHEMEGKKNKREEITDMDAEVMEEMLRFVYTGKAPPLEKMGTALLIAADKYDLQRLKLMCEEALHDKLSVDTASNLLVFADLYSANQLKARAIDFIIHHVTEVMATSGWKVEVMQHPHLIEEVLQSLANEHKHYVLGISEKRT